MAIKKYSLDIQEDLEELGVNDFEEYQDFINHLATDPDYLLLASGTVYSGVEKWEKEHDEFFDFLYGNEEMTENSKSFINRINPILNNLPRKQKWNLIETIIDKRIEEYNNKQQNLINEHLQELGFSDEKANDKDEIHLDLSSSKGTEKIIYLYELGILDYLKDLEPFNYSTNKMATALSAITGEKPSTIQSYINPLLNEDTIQDNNPLNKDKKVSSIKQTLISLGFKPIK